MPISKCPAFRDEPQDWPAPYKTRQIIITLIVDGVLMLVVAGKVVIECWHQLHELEAACYKCS